jgi:hypothetical protein
MGQLITINENSSQLATINALSPDLYFNFISFLDVKEKKATSTEKIIKTKSANNPIRIHFSALNILDRVIAARIDPSIHARILSIEDLDPNEFA